MIPIQNIYFLLCYAWDKLAFRDERWVNSVPDTPLLGLLADILLQHSRRLLKQGFQQGYQQQEAELSAIRGRIQLLESQRKKLPQRQLMQCRYDELSHDLLINQILMESLSRLAWVQELPEKMKLESRQLVHRFPQVKSIDLTQNLFWEAKNQDLRSSYSLLIHVCELLYESLLPTDEEGQYRFVDFQQDPPRMVVLFEAFVRNFYRYEAKKYRVGREHIQWQATTEDNAAVQLLPRMETDVSLISKDKKIIIDAKFYPEAMASNRFGGKKFRPPHLYQLFAYLKNVEAKDELSKHAEGILLYPTAGPSASYNFKMEGHLLRLCSINLMQDWKKIKKDLLSLL